MKNGALRGEPVDFSLKECLEWHVSSVALETELISDDSLHSLPGL